MSKIEYTLKLEVETDAVLDDMAVIAIATAITDGMNTNVDENTIIDVKDMDADFVAPKKLSIVNSSSTLNEPALAQETEYDGQP